MSRTLMIAKTTQQRETLEAAFPDAIQVRFSGFASAMQKFKADPQAVLICQGWWMIQGHSMPENTVVMMSAGFTLQEYTQGYARARPGTVWDS